MPLLTAGCLLLVSFGNLEKISSLLRFWITLSFEDEVVTQGKEEDDSTSANVAIVDL